MIKRLKILYVSSEVAPFAKTGGLGDVAGSLPGAIRKLNHDIRVIMPLYRCIMERKYDVRPLKAKISIPMGRKAAKGKIYQSCLGEVPVYFLRRDSFYYRRYLYGNSKGVYSDNAARFIFFSRAVLEALKGIEFFPDIIHCNDWHSGLLSVYLNTIYKREPSYSRIATLYTIHNVAYQGKFLGSNFSLTCLPNDLFNPEGIEFWGMINFMKGGILFSDLINTVSNRYSEEIQTKEYGFGLEGVFRSRSRDLYGVLNGVDYNEWNPLTDRYIISNYSERDLSGKKACKEDLLREFSLKLSLDIPVIGIISRLVDQKGFDILLEAMKDLMSMSLGIVLLGTGDRLYKKLFKDLVRKYPGRLGVKIVFDNVLAHKIQAGSDLSLIPSKYEPCGLNQIYNLHYGTIPIVRATGGLDDTIEDYEPASGRGNGFKFHDYSFRALIDKVRSALETYKDKRAWHKLMIKAMREDFSWKSSARRYEELYYKAVDRKNSADFRRD